MKELKRNKLEINKKMFFLALFFSVLIFSLFAEDVPLVSTINSVVAFVQGKLILAVCVLAIVATGVMMIFNKGQGSKIAFITILVGVGIVQGAAAIAKLILGTN